MNKKPLEDEDEDKDAMLFANAKMRIKEKEQFYRKIRPEASRACKTSIYDAILDSCKMQIIHIIHFTMFDVRRF